MGTRGEEPPERSRAPLIRVGKCSAQAPLDSIQRIREAPRRCPAAPIGENGHRPARLRQPIADVSTALTAELTAIGPDFPACGGSNGEQQQQRQQQRQQKNKKRRSPKSADQLCAVQLGTQRAPEPAAQGDADDESHRGSRALHAATHAATRVDPLLDEAVTSPAMWQSA
ncbi:unnamed protein product [Lampetra planeri]